MESKSNVYDRARGVVRELRPLLHAIREHDKSLAHQLKRRAAQSVVVNIAEARGSDGRECAGSVLYGLWVREGNSGFERHE